MKKRNEAVFCRFVTLLVYFFIVFD